MPVQYMLNVICTEGSQRQHADLKQSWVKEAYIKRANKK